MSFKKIPPINIILFLIMLGVIAAATVGVIKLIKEQDDPYNNYVKNTYNAPLSKHYTDSLSRTPLAGLGDIEIQIYDSIENIHKPYVLCSITTYGEMFSLNEVKNRAVTAFLAVFPNETWNGEFKYTHKEINRVRWVSMHLSPKSLENDMEWMDD